MFKIQRPYYLLLVLAIVLGSCSDYQRLVKSTDPEKKYEGALKYYNQKDYQRALPLLEELVPVYKATKKAEKIYYYYSYTHYGLQDFATASYHFENFVKSYPNSEHAEECQFLTAYCYYLDSPGPTLDQTNTYKAISELQFFADKYPQSTKVAQCNELIDQLRAKLEEKSFRSAILYYHIENYKAAVVSFKNVLKEFPESKHMEECMFLTVKSYYLYAKNSIDEKKIERYKAAVDAFTAYAEKFAQSKNFKEAEYYYKESLKRIEKQKNNNS